MAISNLEYVVLESAVLFFIGSLVCGACWIWLSHKFSEGPHTPRGFGVLFVPLMLVFGGPSIHDLYVEILVLSMIYFLDDLGHLSPIFRLSIQVLASYLVLERLTDIGWIAFITLMFCLTLFINLFNFQDGADLNVSSIYLIILLSILSLNYPHIDQSIILGLTFIICFSFFNRPPARLYFGDSGIFAFTIFLVAEYLAIAGQKDIFFVDANWMLINIFCYLAVDWLVVVILKIRKREKLLARHYMHLYQILENEGGLVLRFSFFGAMILLGFTGSILLTRIYSTQWELILALVFSFMGLMQFFGRTYFSGLAPK